MVLFLLFAWDFWKGASRKTWPPIPNLLLGALAICSIIWVPSHGRGAWIKVAIGQTCFVGLVSVWVFRSIVRGPEYLTHIRRMALILGCSVSVCCLIALLQYMDGGKPDVLVRGWYNYRGQLAPVIAMMVPACMAFVLMDKDPAVRVGAGALGLLGLCICLTGGGVLAALVGLLALAAFRLSDFSPAVGIKKERNDWQASLQATLVVAAVILTLTVIFPMLPRSNPEILWRNVTLYAETETPRGIEEHPTARIRRHQAALNRLKKDNTWLRGVGVGQFQHSINQYYAPPYNKPHKATNNLEAFDMDADEPYLFNLLETTTVELGVPGVLVLIWLFGYWILSAAKGYLMSPGSDPRHRMLALASLGAGVGALVVSLFGNPWVRGCGGIFAFWMGLGLALADPENLSDGTDKA